MTVEEYRQRMIDAFHKADCDELIALVVMPTEKEFEQLEGLLKTHYKKQPCEDAVSRQAVLDAVDRYIYKSQSTGTQDDFYSFAELVVKALPPVTPKQRTGKWIPTSDIEKWGYKCSVCGGIDSTDLSNYCRWCGAEMEGESE